MTQHFTHCSVATAMEDEVVEVGQCFSTFLLQRNLPQMFVLLMEPYEKIPSTQAHNQEAKPPARFLTPLEKYIVHSLKS